MLDIGGISTSLSCLLPYTIVGTMWIKSLRVFLWGFSTWSWRSCMSLSHSISALFPISATFLTANTSVGKRRFRLPLHWPFLIRLYKCCKFRWRVVTWNLLSQKKRDSMWSILSINPLFIELCPKVLEENSSNAANLPADFDAELFTAMSIGGR